MLTGCVYCMRVAIIAHCLTLKLCVLLTDRRLPSDLTLSQFLRQLYNHGLAMPGEICISLCYKSGGGDKLIDRQHHGLLTSLQ